jgi:hypothetical protein
MLEDRDDMPNGFSDLESRIGIESAYQILLMLEYMEGVPEEKVSGLSHEARLENVFCLMMENARYQTKH